MDHEYIVQTVNEALAEEFELDMARLVPSAHIRDDLNLDSLDIVDMIMALEQAFHFKLEDRSRILGIRTMQDVYDFIAAIHQDKTPDQ